MKNLLNLLKSDGFWNQEVDGTKAFLSSNRA